MLLMLLLLSLLVLVLLSLPLLSLILLLLAPIFRHALCIGFYISSYTRSTENLGVTDISYIILRPTSINRGWESTLY